MDAAPVVESRWLGRADRQCETPFLAASLHQLLTTVRGRIPIYTPHSSPVIMISRNCVAGQRRLTTPCSECRVTDMDVRKHRVSKLGSGLPRGSTDQPLALASRMKHSRMNGSQGYRYHADADADGPAHVVRYAQQLEFHAGKNPRCHHQPQYSASQWQVPSIPTSTHTRQITVKSGSFLIMKSHLFPVAICSTDHMPLTPPLRSNPHLCAHSPSPLNELARSSNARPFPCTDRTAPTSCHSEMVVGMRCRSVISPISAF